MSETPTGTVTFLFTDIEGSARLWEASPDAMRPALARHDHLLRTEIEGTGHVFKAVGDGFCAAFAKAPDALAAALAAQRALAAEPWGLPAPLRVRMALHAGDAEERDGDYFGPTLSRAARLLAAGHGGQTLVSEVVQSLTCDALPSEASLRSLGRHGLRDLARPEAVFQLLHPALPGDFPPLRFPVSSDLPNNLPLQSTSFVGREREAAEVRDLLGKTRLLTLTGAGGAGKTRLALLAAAGLLTDHDGRLTAVGDGVWLAELAALSDPTLVPQAIARTLRVREEPGKPLTQTLAEALQARRLLLVLDNCEHLIDACASLAAALLRDCPHIRFLATSREPLGVAGERAYHVPSLSLPDPAGVQTAQCLTGCESVRLFAERAQAVRASFTVTDANADAVAQVCRRLDGIPLAIELAAARVRSLSVEEIGTRLDDRFRLLTGGGRDALPRQRTLRATINWSYGLLNAPEKALLGRLSVFAGGWSLEAAEEVCAGGDVEACEVLDLLTALVDKSLVTFEERDSAGCYRLLETVRQYAGDRLRESGEAAVRDGHLSWFLALAEEAEPHLEGPEQATWFSRLEAEHDNLRAALDWGGRSPAAEQALRLATALRTFWFVRGHWREGRGLLEVALARVEAGGETRAVMDAFIGLGLLSLAFGRGGWEAARSYYGRALEISRETGNRAGESRSLAGIGMIANQQGDFEAARSLFEQSMETSREAGDRRCEARAMSNLGLVMALQGDFEAARPLFEQALEISRETGDRRCEANNLNTLGVIADERGDFEAARSYYEQALEISRGVGDRRYEANNLNELGEVACRQGKWDVARSYYGQALEINREIGNRVGEAEGLTGLGTTAHAEGRRAEARDFFAQSLSLNRSLSNSRGEATTLVVCAALAMAEGDPRNAARVIAAGESLFMDLPSFRKRALEETLDVARTALGEEGFAAAWAEGQKATPQEALQHTLAGE